MRRLITIPISHYCEKARWALERAGLSYEEEPHVQMAHWPHALLAGGKRTVPVLVAEGTVCTESSDILRYADLHTPPEQQLYPEPYADQVATFERDLDADFGVETRRVVYGALARPGGRELLEINNQGVPAWEGWLLRMSFPVSRRFLLRYLNVTDASVTEARDRVQRALDRVAQRLDDGRPYLFGDRFTAADLCFAALSAPISLPTNYGVVLPTRAETLARDPLADQFWEHPAIAFASRLFAEHRPGAPRIIPSDARESTDAPPAQE